MTEEARKKKSIVPYLAVGTLAFVLNYSGNLVYSLFILEPKRVEIKQIADARNYFEGLLYKFGIKLETLKEIECETDKCLRFRGNLNELKEKYSLRHRELDKSLEENIKEVEDIERKYYERGLVYGYFK